MKQILNRTYAWIDSRTLPERGVLFALAVVLLVVLANQLLLQPTVLAEQRLNKTMRNDLATIGKMQAAMQEIATNTVVDPNASKKATLRKLSDDAAAAEAAIARLRGDLVAPVQMVALLETIIARQGTLHLVALNKLPIQSLNAAPAPDAQAKPDQPAFLPAGGAAPTTGNALLPDTVYKHGVEIIVEGTYQEIYDYLFELEKLSGKVVWGKLQLNVDAHPKTRATLELFTLSLEKKWINL